MESELLRYERLAEDLSGFIVAGNLRPGERLPSVRRLSRERRLSVSTVLQALASARRPRPRRSTAAVRVLRSPCRGAARPTQRPLDPRGAGPGRCQPAPDACICRPAFCRGSRRSRRLCPRAQPVATGRFTATLRRCRTPPSAAARSQQPYQHGRAGTGPPAGPALGWLGRTAGGERVRDHQFLYRGPGLCLRAVTSPGDTVAVESPGYYLMLQLLETLGLKALEIPTDPRTRPVDRGP
jgi:DNA-binding transcriptional MocR family regulator